MDAPTRAISCVGYRERIGSRGGWFRCGIRSLRHIDHLDVTLNWSQSEGTGAWPADMLVEVGLPDGSCVALVATTSPALRARTSATMLLCGRTIGKSATQATDLCGCEWRGIERHGFVVHHVDQRLEHRRCEQLRRDLHDDGLCTSDDIDIPGCTDATACNYDPNATVDDGSCDFSSCSGCTDAMACNYNPNATEDDGSCEFDSCVAAPMRRLATTTLQRPSTMALVCSWMHAECAEATTAPAADVLILRPTTTPQRHSGRW